MLNKPVIQQRFRMGLSTYDNHAIIQQKMAKSLIDLLTNYISTINPINAFEIGCGTGYLTEQLSAHFKITQLTLNDLVPECQPLIEEKTSTYSFQKQYLMGDAEQLSFPAKQDLIISGSTVQWFQNFPDFINKSYESLNPKGILAIGTFGPSNFEELKRCGQKGLEYPSFNNLKKMIGDNFSIIEHKEWQEKLQFSNPVDVLRHLKNTGVNSFNNEIWTKSKLNYFVNQYQKLFSEKSVEITYHPILLILKKREKCQPIS